METILLLAAKSLVIAGGALLLLQLMRKRSAADRSWIGYEPVGVVLAVMPWNFPLWQVVRFAAPEMLKSVVFSSLS